MKKVVFENTKSKYNGRGILISKIKQHDVRFGNRIMTSKICSSSREDDTIASFIHVTYMMCVENAKVKLCEILRAQLFVNLERKRSKTQSIHIIIINDIYAFPPNEEIFIHAYI